MEKENHNTGISNLCILIAIIGPKVSVGMATLYGCKACSFITKLFVEWMLCSISESTSLLTFSVEVDFTFARILWLLGWC